VLTDGDSVDDTGGGHPAAPLMWRSSRRRATARRMSCSLASKRVAGDHRARRRWVHWRCSARGV